MPPKHFHLHLVSDSTGETASSVARAAGAQFDDFDPQEHVWSLVRTKSQMERVIQAIDAEPGPVMHTIVEPEMIEMLKKICHKHGQPCISAIGAVVAEFSSFLGQEVHALPGRQHALDDEYFSRVEAINYALAHDDGQSHWELDDADIVLVGPSRTSKSPTCMYLAYKGYKTANIPFVFGCPLPPILEDLKKPLVIGLTISPDRLQDIRRSRLQAIKQDEETNYVDSENIQMELQESRRLFHRHRWPVIDVTRRSVEETAATILQYYQKHTGAEA